MLPERVTAEATHSWLLVIFRLLPCAPTVDCYPDFPVHLGSELITDQGDDILFVASLFPSRFLLPEAASQVHPQTSLWLFTEQYGEGPLSL